METIHNKSIEITKISSRGQLVIPKSVREKLAWETGDHVAVEIIGDMVVLKRLSLKDLSGKQPVTASSDRSLKSKIRLVTGENA